MNNADNYYFWLGEDGNVEPVSKEKFDRKQKEWQGERPKKTD